MDGDPGVHRRWDLHLGLSSSSPLCRLPDTVEVMKFNCSQCDHDNVGALTDSEHALYRAAEMILDSLNESVAKRGGWQRYAALLSTRPEKVSEGVQP